MGGDYARVEPRIQYEFTVGAETFRSERIKAGGPVIKVVNNRDAYDTVDRYPVGAEVTATTIPPISAWRSSNASLARGTRVLDSSFGSADNASMVNHPVRLVFSVLFLGWLVDFLFWKQRIGLNFALYFGLGILVGLLWLLGEGRRPAWQSLILVVPTASLLEFVVIRRESLTMWLSALFALISIGLMVVSYAGGRWPSYGLAGYIGRQVLLFSSLVAEPFRFIHWQASDPEQNQRWRKLGVSGPVFRGILIAIPIIILFTALLAAADLIFNQLVREFFADWTFARVVEYVFRQMLILGLAYGILGIIRHAYAHSHHAGIGADPKGLLKPFLDFTEILIVLGSVLVLFAIFVSLQFRYFFGGQINIGAEGFTFSQYARRGFSELVTVGFISLLLVMGASAISRRETQFQQWIFFRSKHWHCGGCDSDAHLGLYQC